MSRHSKNNTASSIFTYGERNRLQDWGTVKQRVGKDSQKAFDQCELCLTRVIEPMACTSGHMFCRVCIIENLITQKKQNDISLKKWTHTQELLAKKTQQEQQQKTQDKINKFEKVELTLPETDKSQLASERLGMLEPELREKLQYAEKMREEKHKITTLETEKLEEIYFRRKSGLR